MYGNGSGVATARGAETVETEHLSSINSGTINMLEACRRSLDHMLGKVFGPRPEQENKSLPNVPSLMSDARQMNELARQLQSRLEEIHQAIGHDKQ
jgi:hypothetical protein